MKSLLIIPLLLLLITAGCTKTDTAHKAEDSTAAAKEVYTCPMHPSVISDRPGACPVCGMALVKKTAQKELPAGETAMLRTVSLAPAQRIMANVATAPVARRAMRSEISAVGVIDFAEPLLANVSAPYRGRIEKLHVDYTGRVVRKGEALFDLYSPDLMAAQQDYLGALAALQAAQEAGDVPGEEMQQRLVSSARDRLRVHYALPVTQIAELEKAGKARPAATYLAPISGTVIAKNITAGQYVDEGTTLYRLADLSRVWAYVEVYESDLRFVRTGQAVTLTTEAYPGRSFPGRVTFIDPVVNSATRTVRVRAELANQGGLLKPQMYVKAAIASAAREVLALPQSAIVQTGSRNVVWIETRANQFEPRDVTLGARSDGYIEIADGLREGESAVVSGGYLLDSESQLSMPGGGGHDMAQTDKPSSTAPASSGGNDHATTERLDGSTKSERIGVREIRIEVDGAYEPEQITVARGEKVRLLFHRNEDSRCTDEVVFKDFGIRRKLPAFKTTAVELTPRKAGTFQFSCGMDMVHGTLVVR